MGNLHMLVLSNDGQRVVGLKLEALGRISTPATLSYLDSGVVFVVGHRDTAHTHLYPALTFDDFGMPTMSALLQCSGFEYTTSQNGTLV